VADGAVIPFPAAIFESDNFGGAIVGDNFGNDLGTSDRGFAYLNLAVLDNKQDVRKLC
jgi:hypothetical protein